MSPALVQQGAYILAQLGVGILGYLVLSKAGEAVLHRLSRAASQTATEADDLLVRLVRHVWRFVVFLGLLAAFLWFHGALGILGSLAGAVGIGSLALALAAKDTAANLFGFAAVTLDRLFDVGDEVNVAGGLRHRGPHRRPLHHSRDG